MPLKDVLLFWLIFFASLCLLEFITEMVASQIRKMRKKSVSKVTPYVLYQVKSEAQQKRSA